VDQEELIAFVRRRGQAVLATCGPDGAPQATQVSIAVTDHGEFVFDMSVHSREHQNIAAVALVALVVGGDEEVSVQCEGTAQVLAGADRDRCLRTYFQQHPQARVRALASYMVQAKVLPRTLRLSDRRPDSFGVQEIHLQH
jgi:pyridoxine/pyridoxamine 5'-phosphate oxidase